MPEAKPTVKGTSEDGTWGLVEGGSDVGGGVGGPRGRERDDEVEVEGRARAARVRSAAV